MHKITYILGLLLLAQCTWGQNVSGSFMHGGILRSYTIYIPNNYNSVNNHPLVLNLHGYGSNGTQQAGLTQMNVIADTAGFVVVYPEGTLDASFKQYWNAGYGSSIDDVGFISALIDTVAANYNINLQRVYSTGLSNGGIMSNSLACALNHKIAAIAAVAGTMSIGQYANCSPSYKIPVMHIHGTSDAIVPYNGNAVLLGVDSLVAYWVGHNGLANSYTTTAIPNTNLFDGSTAEWRKYEIGANYPVYLIRVNNGGHSWPGSGVIVSGSTNMDFNASDEIWKFFNRYSLITSIPSVEIETHIGQEIVNWTGLQPAQGTINWEIKTDSRYVLRIYNIYGQEMVSKAYSNAKEASLNIEKLLTGTYVALFSTKEKTQTLKFVKK